jgi:hypothetical protein
MVSEKREFEIEIKNEYQGHGGR